jgi:hypothetical protein
MRSEAICCNSSAIKCSVLTNSDHLNCMTPILLSSRGSHRSRTVLSRSNALYCTYHEAKLGKTIYMDMTVDHVNYQS